MASYNDQLNFNESGIKTTVGNLSEVSNNINNKIQEYTDYVNNQLSPNWTTDNGRVSIEKLNEFANGNLKDFREYLQGQIQNLENVQGPVSNINEA